MPVPTASASTIKTQTNDSQPWSLPFARPNAFPARHRATGVPTKRVTPQRKATTLSPPVWFCPLETIGCMMIYGTVAVAALTRNHKTPMKNQPIADNEPLTVPPELLVAGPGGGSGVTGGAVLIFVPVPLVAGQALAASCPEGGAVGTNFARVIPAGGGGCWAALTVLRLCWHHGQARLLAR